MSLPGEAGKGTVQWGCPLMEMYMFEMIAFVVVLGWIVKAFKGWARFFMIAILVIGAIACL